MNIVAKIIINLPMNTMRTPWKIEGALEDLKLLFQVGKRLAFEEKMPQWKPGSEFKKLRK